VNQEATALVGEAQGALAAGRWSTAVEAFRTLLERNEDADARFGLGIGLFWTGETVAALREWERAYVVYRRRGDYSQAVLAAGYLCLAYRMSMGNDAAAEGWLGRTARLVSDHGLADMTGWLLVCRAHLAVDAGHLHAAERWAREACDLAHAAGDLDLELCALSELGAAVVELGRVEEGTALLDEAMAGALAGEGRTQSSSTAVDRSLPAAGLAICGGRRSGSERPTPSTAGMAPPTCTPRAALITAESCSRQDDGRRPSESSTPR
jgi:tetratricopeptide (TPR) repeat protein